MRSKQNKRTRSFVRRSLETMLSRRFSREDSLEKILFLFPASTLHILPILTILDDSEEDLGNRSVRSSRMVRRLARFRYDDRILKRTFRSILANSVMIDRTPRILDIDGRNGTVTIERSKF